MEQFGSQWADFHEISYMRIFRKCPKNGFTGFLEGFAKQ